jgi:hypothetical protein
MPSEFVSTLQSQPLTLAHVVLMAAVFLYQLNYDVAFDKVGVQYERECGAKEAARAAPLGAERSWLTAENLPPDADAVACPGNHARR